MRWCSVVVAGFMLACGGSPAPEAPPGPRALHAYGATPDGYALLSGTVYMAVDAGKVLSAPDVDGAVVTELALGAPVQILTPVGEPTILLSRTQQWYQVRSDTGVGFVFGALLTPHAGRVDHPIHGPVDWTMSISDDLRPLLRTKHHDSAESVTVELTRGGNGGFFRVETHPYGNRALEWTLSQCSEDGTLCEDGVVRLFDELVVASVPDRSEHRPELIDEPRCADPTTLQITPQGPTSALSIPLSRVGHGDEASCAVFGTASDGDPVVDCSVVVEQEGRPPIVRTDRFVQRSKARWERLRCSSTLHPDLLPSELANVGRKVVDRDGIALPATLETAVNGYSLVRHVPGPTETTLLLTHPELGHLRPDERGQFAVPQPTGHLLYAWDPGVPYYVPSVKNCSGDVVRANRFLEPKTEPEPIQFEGDVQLYAVPKTEYYALGRSFPEQRALDCGERPWVLTRGPAERWVVLTYESLPCTEDY